MPNARGALRVGMAQTLVVPGAVEETWGARPRRSRRRGGRAAMSLYCPSASTSAGPFPARATSRGPFPGRVRTAHDAARRPGSWSSRA